MSEQNKDEKKVHRRRYSLCENMFISFIITFAAGTICYESTLPEGFVNFYRTVVFILCIFTWIAISLFSGIRNKWQYEIFTVLFWIVPQIIIYLADNGPEFCRMSLTMYLLSEFSLIVFTRPAEAMGSAFRIGAVPMIFVIILVSTFAFLAGNLFSDKLKKGNYTF